MRGLRPATAGIAAALLLGAGCSRGREARVAMNGEHRFVPDTITVSPGQTITFTNEGGEAHTVTAYQQRIPSGAEYFASGGFGSERQARATLAEGLVTQGEVYRVTLQQSGTYDYVCLTHEQDGMRGTIVVER
jgi:plastocyanin